MPAGTAELLASAHEVGRFLKGFREWREVPLPATAEAFERACRTRGVEEAAQKLKGYSADDPAEYLRQLEAGPSMWTDFTRVEVRFLADVYELPHLMLDPLFSRTVRNECLAQSIAEFVDVTEPGDPTYGTGAEYSIPPTKLETGTDVSFGRVKLAGVKPGEPSSRSDFHDHPGTELMFLLEGEEIELRLEGSGVRVPIRKGEFVHFWAELPHAAVNLRETPALLFVVRCYQLQSDSTRRRVMGIIRRTLDNLSHYEDAVQELKRKASGMTPQELLDAVKKLPVTEREGRDRPHLDLPNFVRSLTERVGSRRLKELRAQLPDRVEDRFGLALLLDRLRAERPEKDRSFSALGKRGPFSAAQLHEIRHAARPLTLADVQKLAVQYEVEAMLLYPHLFPAEPDVVAGRIDEMAQVPADMTEADYHTPRCNLALSDVQLFTVGLAGKHATKWNRHPGFELAVPLDGGEIAVEWKDRDELRELRGTGHKYAHFSSKETHRLRNLGDSPVRVFVARFYGGHPT